MKIAGIIAEYNPFHSGHALQICETRKAGATHIVAVMSGCYVQRGEPAMVDKWVRAKAAINGGVDLVIELPVPYSVSTAQKFAMGAVQTLEGLGCVDMLSFGSEIGKIEPIKELAEFLQTSTLQNYIYAGMLSGNNYPTARQKAVAHIFGDDMADFLAAPNNILGLEYMRALYAINSKIEPITIKRCGAAHDSEHHAEHASASFLRKLLQQGEVKSVMGYMPEKVHKIFAQSKIDGRALNREVLERAMLAKVRGLSKEQIAQLPDVTEGLENRIFTSIHETNSIADAIAMVKTKRYSHARLRRIMLCAWLGIDANLCDYTPPYIHILGMNDKGREILSVAKKTATLPMGHSRARFIGLGGNARAFAETEVKVDNMYAAVTDIIQPCGRSYDGIIIEGV